MVPQARRAARLQWMNRPPKQMVMLALAVLLAQGTIQRVTSRRQENRYLFDQRGLSRLGLHRHLAISSSMQQDKA